MRFAGVEKSRPFIIRKLADEHFSQLPSAAQQGPVEKRFIEIQQTDRQEGVVVQVSQQLRLTVFIRVQQETLAKHLVKDKFHRPPRGVDTGGIPGNPDRGGQPGKRQTVPRGDNFIIAKRLDPLLPLGKKFFFGIDDQLFDDRRLRAKIFASLLDTQDRVQDFFLLEISRFRDVVNAAKSLAGLIAEHSGYLIGSPDEKFSFFTLAVGV